MNETPTTSPRPKAKKNKIRPKLKPIVSTNEDDDEGLGYGEWAPSPLKPRQAPENNWSGSEEDEKKDEDTTIHVIKKSSPKVQPVSSEEEEVTKEVERPESRLDARSNPTQSKRGFDNKLQLSESSTDQEEKISDNRASNIAIHTQQAANSSIENILLDESLQWLRSRLWKGLIVLLFIATSCEVFSIAIITKVRLYHVEQSGIATIEETGADEVLSLSKDENNEVPNVELIEVEDEAAEPAISKVPLTEEAMLPVVSVVNDEQSDTKEEGQANGLPEIELVKLEEDATGDDNHTAIEVDLSSEEVHEGLESNDEQPSAQEDDESEAGMDEQASDGRELEAEDNLPLSEVLRERLESNDVHPSANEDEESEVGANGLPETDSGNLEAEEQVTPSGEVHEGFERNDEQPIARDDEGSESQAGANEFPETDNRKLLSEEAFEVFESNDEQPIAREDEESESGVNELPEADSSYLEAENYVLPQSEEVTVNEDLDANSESDENELAEADDSNDIEEPEVVITPSMDAAEEVAAGFESNDEQPDAREDEQSEADVDEQASDSSELEAEEYSSPPEEVTERDAIQALPVTTDENFDSISTLDPLVDEGLVDESDANEPAETDLVEVEITVEDSDNDEQPELVVTPSEEAAAEKESEIVSVEEVSASDEQPVTNTDDAAMPPEEPESDEKEHATIEIETTSEDGSDQHEPEGSPSLDDQDDNDREDTEHELQQELPCAIETKRKFLATLEKFEDTFESYEVIDALIGHVACAIPKLLVKRILGAAKKVKGRFSKKQ